MNHPPPDDKFLILTWQILGDTYKRLKLPGGIQSLDECSRYLPEGVYTTFRTYNRHYIFRFTDHLERLKESAKILGGKVDINPLIIKRILRIAINKLKDKEFRIRLTTTCSTRPAQIFVSIAAFNPPADQYFTEGVRVGLVRYYRSDPEAKKTHFIVESDPFRKELGDKYHEMIMVDDGGYLLEGLSSNFFGVIDQILYTAGQGVLHGITQKIVLEAAQNLLLTTKLEAIHTSQIDKLSEAFITSSGRSILPVVEINNTKIGVGVPGIITKKLLDAYNQKITTGLIDLYSNSENDTT